MNFAKKLYQRLPIVSLLIGGLKEFQKFRAMEISRFVSDLLKSDPRFADPKSLARHEFQVFSQSGEDGVLREIFRRIGCESRHFVEFGVENGLENNTHFLLQQGWTGCWIEGNEKHCASIRDHFSGFIANGRLKVQHSFITGGNIAKTFKSLEVPNSFDLLSIDIDGNDYWVWECLGEWKPKVVVIEYNSHFPPDYEWIMPQNDSGFWDMRSLHYGASLKSLELLGERLGYQLVYCNFAGSNAFFVHKSHVKDRFADNSKAEYHFSSFRPWLVQRGGYAPDPRPGTTGNAF